MYVLSFNVLNSNMILCFECAVLLDHISYDIVCYYMSSFFFIILILCSFVNSDEGGDSIRYLHAYCYMHRLFLQFLSIHPTLVSSGRETLKGFIADPAKRHMDVCGLIWSYRC